MLAAVLLAAAVLLIIGNTIRLDIENRRAEIEVCKLLGATDGFIRRPFLYGGFWYGALGGLFATLLVLLASGLMAAPVAGLADAYNSSYRLNSLGLGESLQLTALGAGIGWLGSWLAVGRQLAAIQPD